MMEEDEAKVEANVWEIIDRFRHTLESNVQLLKNNDWTDSAEREQRFELESHVVSAVITNATELYDLVKHKKRDEAKIAYGWLDKLLEAYKISEKRCEKFFKKGIQKTGKVDAKELKRMTELVSFQTKVNTYYAKGKNRMGNIRLDGGLDKTFKLSLRKNTPVVSLPMRGPMEEKYPEITEIVETRKKEYYARESSNKSGRHNPVLPGDGPQNEGTDKKAV